MKLDEINLTDSLQYLKQLTEKLAEELRIDKMVDLAIEQSQEAVLITDTELDEPGPKILFVNRAFERMTGYNRDEIIGKTPRILQGKKTDRKTLDRLRESLSNGESFFGRAINYKKNGEPYLLEWHISQVVDDDGNSQYYVSIQRSLTDLPLITREERDAMLESLK